MTPLRSGRFASGTTCVDHVDGPSGYVAWQEWATEKAKTHQQWRCSECGLWAIWLPVTTAEQETP